METVKQLVIKFVNKIEYLQKEIEKANNAETIEQLNRRIKLHKDTIYQALKIDYIERGGTETEYMEFVNSLLKEKETPKQEQQKEITKTPEKTTEDINIVNVIKEINDYEFYKFDDDLFKLLSQLYNVLKSEVINSLCLKPSIEKNNKREYVDKLLKLFMEGMDRWTATNKGYNNKNWINNLHHAQLLCYLIEYDKAMDKLRNDVVNYLHSYSYD